MNEEDKHGRDPFIERVAWAIIHSMYPDIEESAFKRYLSDLHKHPFEMGGSVADDGMKAARAAIDAVPQMFQVETDYGKNLEDLVHFAPRIPQLILPEDTVGDLLDKALNLQADRRREILTGPLKKTIGLF